MANIALTKNLKLSRPRGGFVLFPKDDYHLKLVDWINSEEQEVLQDLVVVETATDEVVYSVFIKRSATTEGTVDTEDIVNQAAYDTYNETKATLKAERQTLREELLTINEEISTLRQTVQATKDAKQVLEDSGTATDTELTDAQTAIDVAIVERDDKIGEKSAKQVELDAKRVEEDALAVVEPEYKIKNKYEDAVNYIGDDGNVTPEGLDAIGDIIVRGSKLNAFI